MRTTELCTKNLVCVDRASTLQNAGEACGLVSSHDTLRLLSREISGIGTLIKTQTEDGGGSPEKPKTHNHALRAKRRSSPWRNDPITVTPGKAVGRGR